MACFKGTQSNHNNGQVNKYLTISIAMNVKTRAGEMKVFFRGHFQEHFIHLHDIQPNLKFRIVCASDTRVKNKNSRNNLKNDLKMQLLGKESQ